MADTLELETIRPSSSNYRPDIQGLRALAVVLVILCHASVPHFGAGYVGVDVFFVISGFVITSLLLRQPEGQLWRNLGHFYARRARRILPASALVLILTMIATYYWLGAYVGNILATDVRWASLFSANFHFISVGQNYFTQGQKSLIEHYWSLAVEEQFYFVIPLALFTVTAVVALRFRRLALASLLGVVIVASSVWSVVETHQAPSAAYFSPFTRFWELALGALVATMASRALGNVPTLFSSRPPRWLRPLVQWVAFGSILYCALSYPAEAAAPGQIPGWKMWGPCAAAAILLWPTAQPSKWSPASLLAWRPVRYLGDVSYSLYLYHYAWLMIPLTYALTPAMSAWSRVLQIAGAVACSVVSYHVLENPIRRSKALDRRPLASLPIALACVGLVWLVAWLCQTYWTL